MSLFQGGLKGITNQYLKAFAPENIDTVKSSGASCPVSSDAQGLSAFIILLIIVGVFGGLGIVVGVVFRMPGSLESGFSNFSNHAQITMMMEKLTSIESKMGSINPTA